jgi:hypothetical protein
MRRFFLRNCYYLLSALLVILTSIWIYKAQWSGDFFTHSAVVAELMRHPLHPQNPIIDSDVPHAFNSPYTLMVSLCATLLHTGPISALGLFAMLNLVLFLWAFAYFCRSFKQEKWQQFAFTGLLLILFLSGSDPFIWSGFFNVFTFFRVLPYPSTFAISLTFIAIGWVVREPFAKKLSLQMLALIFLAAIIFIVHPNTWVFLICGIFTALIVVQGFSLPTSIIAAVGVVTGSLLICLAWPYYDVKELLWSDVDYQAHSKELYTQVFQRTWPVLITIPFLFYQRNKKVVRFFLMLATVLLLLYVAGNISGHYGIGRVLSPLMMMLQLCIANVLTENKEPLKAYAATCGLLLLCMFLNLHNAKDLYHLFRNSRNTEYYTRYDFIDDHVPEGSTVFANLRSSNLLPAFGVKVVATYFPGFGIKDMPERRKALEAVFQTPGMSEEKWKLVKGYSAEYLLIDSAIDTLGKRSILEVMQRSDLVCRQGELFLFRLKPRAL